MQKRSPAGPYSNAPDGLTSGNQYEVLCSLQDWLHDWFDPKLQEFVIRHGTKLEV